MICRNCNAEIRDGVKFCPECGTSIDYSQPRVKPTQNARKSTNCPNCGAALPSFVQNCPCCGTEVRGASNASSVESFAQKYQSLDTNKKKIDLIRTFAIPNTREDIIEFIFLAAANIDEKSCLNTEKLDNDVPQSNVAEAWMSKLDQAYQKATMVIPNDPTFAKINEIYNEKKKIAKKTGNSDNKSILISFIPLLAMLLIGAIILICSSISSSRSEDKKEAIESSIQEAFNAEVSEIQEKIENGLYDSALVQINLLDESSDQRKKTKNALRNQILELQGKAEGMLLIPEIPEGTTYTDAETIFKQTGFINVSSEEVSEESGLNKYIGKFTNWMEGKKDGDVVEISINGKTEFESGTYISKDSIIVIRYYKKTEKN